MRNAQRFAARAAGSHTAHAMPAADPDDERDEDLMLTYARGRAEAFDRLYARHRTGVYRYLLRHAGSAGIADELFQDVWLSVIRGRATYAPTARFATWLYTLAHHRIVDHWRTTGQIVSASIDGDGATRDAVDALPAARRDEPHVRVQQRELGARVRGALAALPPLQRDAFLLQQESGLALAEIAELTGVGVETVKSRLRYAIAKLRADLGELRDGAHE